MPERITLVTARRLSREEIYAGLLPGFETQQQAAFNRDNLSTNCFQADGVARSLGTKLGLCMVDSHHCQSAACEYCLREARLQLVPQVSERMHRENKEVHRSWTEHGRRLKVPKPDIYSFTGVDAELAVPRGELDVGMIKRASEAFRQALSRSVLRDTLLYSGWDFSLNFLHAGDPNPMWQPHIFGLVVAPKAVVRGVLQERFAVTEGIPKPLMVKKVPIQSLPGAVSYAFKSRLCRRIGYVASNGRKATCTRRLEEDEHRELAVFLDALGINARLILRGLKVTGGRLVDV